MDSLEKTASRFAKVFTVERPEPEIKGAPLPARLSGSAKKTFAMCSFRLAEVAYGVDITRIREILGPVEPWQVPLAPRFIGGLVHYRGEILTTVSLRSLFGLPRIEALSSVLVVEGPSGRYGLLVDVVEEVVEVDMANFEATPATLDPARKQLLTGVFKLHRGLLIQLDPALLDPLHLAQNLQPAARTPAGRLARSAAPHPADSGVDDLAPIDMDAPLNNHAFMMDAAFAGL